ncbi:MFS transporter [Sphingomonas sp. 1P06PA]|uniref:MFS transporter n=1 Tax=Sphingomonas sp. 1P06PA TaxID=554121 RepID=UPI0039A4EC2E
MRNTPDQMIAPVDAAVLPVSDPAPARTVRPFVRDDARAWYAAGVLALCQMVSFIDRQLINLLVGPIKADFGLSDTSVSMLIGFAFASIHILLAIPFGRWIDHGNRRMIILGCGVLWSLCSMAGGLAQTYEQLFITRMGVGAAEAGIYPACAALVAAYFTRDRLPRAMSIMLLGPFVGGGLSLLFGGLVIGALERAGPIVLPLVGVLAPWQMTLIIISASGVLPVLLILTVREPPRERAVDTGGVAAPGFAPAFRYLRDRARFYGNFYIGIGLHVMAIYAVPAWAPSLLARRFDLTTEQVGVQLGLVSLVAGVSGMLCGPYLGALAKRRGHREASVRGARMGVAMTLPLVVLIPFMPSANALLVLLFLLTFAYTLPLSLASSALQEVTHDRMRGFVGAIYFVAASLAGLALAPTLVGFVTDRVFADPQQVGLSLALVVGTAGALSLVMLSRSIEGYRRCAEEQP